MTVGLTGLKAQQAVGTEGLAGCWTVGLPGYWPVGLAGCDTVGLAGLYDCRPGRSV